MTPADRVGATAKPRSYHWSKVDPARQVAYEAVATVHQDDAYANLALPAILRKQRIRGLDAAFATELTYGTLRTQGTLDAVVAHAARRDVTRIDPPTRDALRLGAYQVLFTRVPPHAAVSTTVDLVRAVAPGAIGFANAVLRRIVEVPLDQWLTRLAPDPGTDPIGHLALTTHHPAWIVRAYADACDACTAAALAANNVPAPVHLCARPGRITAAELAAEVGGQLGRYAPSAVYLPAGAPGELAAVVQRRAHIQDEGSQLVTWAFAHAPLDGPDHQWLDLCAGPGGKAGLLGCLAAHRDAVVTAIEISPHRAALVQTATEGMPVTVRCTDGRNIGGDLRPASFDRVLVDVPCSGLGSLRRRPELRWRRQPSDLPALTRLQRELLTAAIQAVRPGGIVGYVTCSPHLVETHVTINEVVRRTQRSGIDPLGGAAVELIDARPLLSADMPGLGAGPTVQLWPHQHGTDAMFLALLRRPG